MGERSTAGSICDTCPVEVNKKVHKNRGTAKPHRWNQTVKHQNGREFTSTLRIVPVFTNWVPQVRIAIETEDEE